MLLEGNFKVLLSIFVLTNAAFVYSHMNDCCYQLLISSQIDLCLGHTEVSDSGPLWIDMHLLEYSRLTN